MGSAAACTEDDKGSAVTSTTTRAPQLTGDKTLLQVTELDEQFAKFMELMKKAGLDGELAGQQPITVFAPSTAAFAKLDPRVLAELEADPQGRLADMLKLHLVPGALTASDLTDGRSLETLDGVPVAVKVTDGTVSVGGAPVEKFDIAASNGTIFVLGAPITSAG